MQKKSWKPQNPPGLGLKKVEFAGPDSTRFLEWRKIHMRLSQRSVLFKDKLQTEKVAPDKVKAVESVKTASKATNNSIFKIFPLEIWGEIFKSTSLEDLLNLRLASINFNAMLQHQIYDGKCIVLFKGAAKDGDVNALLHIYKCVPDIPTRSKMLKTNHRYEDQKNLKTVFAISCLQGHLEAAKLLYIWSKPIMAIHYFFPPVFADAAKKGHLHIMEQIWNWVPKSEDKSSLLSFQYFHPFSQAAAGGHLQILTQIYEWCTIEKRLMIGNYSENGFPSFVAFQNACGNGHLPIVQQIYQWSSSAEIMLMLKSKDKDSIEYAPIEFASANGHLRVVQQLYTWTKSLINPDVSYLLFAFEEAAAGGHLKVVKQIIAWVGQKEAKQFISYNDYSAFRGVSKNGHLEVIKLLYSLTDKKREMIAARRDIPISSDIDSPQFPINVSAFLGAAYNGHLKVLQQLFDWSKEVDTYRMLLANDCAALRAAAFGGHFNVIRQMTVWVGVALMNCMIRGDGCASFRAACMSGRVEIIRYFYTFFTLEEKMELFSNDWQSNFIYAAVIGGHSEIIYQLHGWSLQIGKPNFVFTAFEMVSNNSHSPIWKGELGYYDIAKILYTLADDNTKARMESYRHYLFMAENK